MKWIKKGVIYFLVIFLLVILLVIFLNIFAFNKETEQMMEDTPSVTDELVQSLYSYLDIPNDSNQVTFYSGYYITYSNLNYSTVNKATYQYIINYAESKLETISDEEFTTLNVNGTPLHKISIDNFTDALHILFGSSASFKSNNFVFDNTISAKISEDYIYFYTTEDTTEDEYVYYKEYVSYTLTDNNNTIKIYEYFLKCNKNTGLCYDSENLDATENVNIKYTDNLDILDYIEYLTMYEHVFTYEDGNYCWYSTDNG